MKKYHLTILRNGIYTTGFGEVSSLAAFIAIEKEVGNDTHIIYSRELSEEEYEVAKKNNL